MNVGNSNGSKPILTNVAVAVVVAIVMILVTSYTGNNKRDTDITVLQTKMDALQAAVSANHEEDVKGRETIDVSLKQLDVHVARIAQKTGVTASPGSK